MIILNEEKYYTLKELSIMFNVQKNTISKWRRSGLIKGLKISERKWLYSETDIKKMLKL